MASLEILIIHGSEKPRLRGKQVFKMETYGNV